MDSSRFAVVIFTMMVLFMIYLDNAGKLKNTIAAAKGIAGTPAAPLAGKTSTSPFPAPQGPLPGTDADYNIPVVSSAPGLNDMPGTIFGAPGGNWFG